MAKSCPVPWAINLHISGDTPPRRSWQHRQPHIVGQRAALPARQHPKRCYFHYLSLSNLAVRYGLKIIDNSTYIVGIYRPAVIGRLYTFHGVGLLSYLSLRHAKASQLDKTKIDFPHLSCTPMLNPFSPGIEEHKTLRINYLFLT